MYEGNYFGRFLKTLWKLASPKDWLTRGAISPLANIYEPSRKRLNTVVSYSIMEDIN